MFISSSLAIISILVYFLIFYFRKKISTIFNVFDLSDEKRKIHKFPTPKTASYALAFLFFTLIIFNYFFKLFEKDIIFVLVGTLTIFLIGFLDDKYKLSAITKTILISFTTFVLCLLSENLVIDKFYIHSLDFIFILGNFSLIFTILSVLCLTNSLNLADGINGLATGIVFFWLIYINQIFDNNFELIINIIFINLVLIFIHNMKGKHFLGDAGSLMLSSFLAYFIIMLNNQNLNYPNHQRSAETILILFLFPVLDMVRLFFERLINKKKVAVGDKNHFHHYLINRFNISKALIIYFLLINVPIILSLYTSINKILIILFIFLMYFSILYNIKKKNEL
jgi:UDP-GlcNAc:undecaprenyl-phosphate GlcNAc-1-phosphate transferase